MQGEVVSYTYATATTDASNYQGDQVVGAPGAAGETCDSSLPMSFV